DEIEQVPVPGAGSSMDVDRKCRQRRAGNNSPRPGDIVVRLDRGGWKGDRRRLPRIDQRPCERVRHGEAERRLAYYAEAARGRRHEQGALARLADVLARRKDPLLAIT